MTATQTSELQDASRRWHNEFSKAFITQCSTEDEYFIKVKFRTMDEMHEAYRAMAALADLTRNREEPK